MVQYDFYNNNKTLVIAKSDNNKYLIQNGTGAEYSEAIDLFDHIDLDGKPKGRYTYTESDKDIESENIL